MILNWKRKGKLEKGDILRTKVGNKKHPKFGQYIYSVCTGQGFGCLEQSLGNAIFVEFASFILDEVIVNRQNVCDGNNTGERWERFWGIEVLEENKIEVEQ